MEKYNKAKSINQDQILILSASTDPLAANYVPPWKSAKLPHSSYTLGAQGLFIEKTIGKGENASTTLKRITLTPVWIDALARNSKGNNYGVQICWVDPDKTVRSSAIPGGRLHDRSLVAELASIGLRTIPGMEQELLRYLGMFEPIRKIQNVDKLGWLDDAKGRLIYVTPGPILAKITDANESDVDIVYQPERHSPSLYTISSEGSLDDWQTAVAGFCTSSDMLIFTVSSAFAGPLLKPAGLDGGGFHFYARSTTGKTTGGLQVPASVWGCGSDPAVAPEKSMIHRWNSTANGLEALAAAHNDGILPIDEVGTTDIKAFGAGVYNITGGSGKNALNSDRSRKEPRTWLNMIISTGEESVQQRIEQQGGKAHAGQLLRIIDIQFPTQLFDTQEVKAAAIIDALKQNCGKYYGTAGPKFIEFLINNNADFSALSFYIQDRLQIAIKQLKAAANNSLSQEQTRAMKRFALVLVAGQLAREANILQFDEEAIDKAVITIFRNWQESNPSLRDSERGVAAVRDFIQRHQFSRFISIKKVAYDPDKTRDLAGFKEDDVFLLFDWAFEEACGEFSHKDVARALKERGLLKIERGDRLKCRRMFNGKSVSFYAISEEIIGHDDEATHDIAAV